MKMVALGISVIMFGEKLQGGTPMLCADALATVDIMNACSARSPALQSIHARILALSELCAPPLGSRLSVATRNEHATSSRLLVV